MGGSAGNSVSVPHPYAVMRKTSGAGNVGYKSGESGAVNMTVEEVINALPFMPEKFGIEMPILADVMTKAVDGAAISIKCYGDSLTYGFESGGPEIGINGSVSARAAYQFPETLKTALTQSNMFTGGVTVGNKGYPGDTILDGLTRWSAEPASDISIIMYGTNDAVSAGAAPTVNATAFKAGYKQTIERELKKGASIVLIMPPALKIINTVQRDRQRNISAYRNIIATLGVEYGAVVLDAQEIIQWLDEGAYSDETHLTATGYNELGWQISAIFSTNETELKRVSSGDEFLPSDALGMSITSRTVSNAGALHGELLEIPAGERLNISLYAEESIIPVISLYNTTATIRTLSAFYSGGAARSGVDDITLTDNSNVPERKKYNVQTLNKGIRTLTISNLTANIAYIETIKFKSIQKAISVPANYASEISAISNKCVSRPQPPNTWDALSAQDVYLKNDWMIVGRMYLGDGAGFCGIGTQAKLSAATNFPQDALLIGRVSNSLVVKELVSGVVTDTTYPVVFTSLIYEYHVDIKITSGLLYVVVDGVSVVAGQAVADSDGYVGMLSQSNEVFKTETILIGRR